MTTYQLKKSTLSIENGIDEDSKVYRIIDFFGAAAMIESNKIMIPQLAEFDDINEGIGVLLFSLFSAWPNAGCGSTVKNIEQFTSGLKSYKENHYVTCWTETPESVAMWSLYSKDACSIRIQTTIGKIRKTMEHFANEFNLGNINNLSDEDIAYWCNSVNIVRIQYGDIHSISKKIKRRVLARKRLETRILRNGADPKILGKITGAPNRRDQYVDGISRDDIAHLKDISYAHENEIRAHASITKISKSDTSLTMLENSKDDDDFNKVNIKDTKRLFTSLCENFIESIAVDPRAPLYKKEFIEKFFSSKGIKIVQSRSFVEKTSYIDVFPAQINPTL